jgi:transcriptional regulator with XRE-family HTH domain
MFIPDKLTCMTEDSDTTIRRVLGGYEIGSKIRSLRLRKKIALVDLGKHTGLSASMLSQLENGKLIPTLPTLARIAMVFDVGVDFFFSERAQSRTFSVVRANERIRFPFPEESAEPNYFFENLAFQATDKPMQGYLAEFPQRPESEAIDHVHDGYELMHVISGTLALRYADKETVLEPGDSVYFDSSEPHGYRGVSSNGARAVVVTMANAPT